MLNRSLACRRHYLAASVRTIAVAVLVAGATVTGHCQIVHDSVVSQGEKVAVQRLTIECPVYVPGSASGWEAVNRKYTLHLANGITGNSTDNQWFSWYSKTWQRYESITENEIVLERIPYAYLGIEYDVCNKLNCVGHTDMQIEARGLARSISRSSLEFETTYDGFRCTEDNYSHKDHLCSNWVNVAQWRIPHQTGQCRVTTYLKPPDRIGF